MMQRERHFKDGLNGLATRKATVAAYTFGSQPVVEIRILDINRRRDLDLMLSLPQAREAVRLLQTAIQAAETATRADGPDATLTGRAPISRDNADGSRIA